MGEHVVVSGGAGLAARDAAVRAGLGPPAGARPWRPLPGAPRWGPPEGGPASPALLAGTRAGEAAAHD